jgi:N-acetylglucosaminyl-diphospho-decaprenol L-rhamnosyltransferase
MIVNTAVIVVTHYSAAVLPGVLDSIAGASAHEVVTVVVDNLTEDGSVDEVVAAYPWVRFVQTGSNLGYGRAINVAVAGLDPVIEWVVIANPDIVFAPGAIDRLVEAARDDPTIGAAGPRILRSDRTVYPSARSLPSLRTGIGHAVFLRVWPKNPWTARYRRVDIDQADRGARVQVGWLSGACLVVRRDVFDAIGGFDPRYFMYFEDVDFGDRIGKAGWRNVYVPAGEATHTGGTSTDRYSRRMLEVHHKSAYIYLSTKYHAWYLWPLRVALNVGLRARAFTLTRARTRPEHE